MGTDFRGLIGEREQHNMKKKTEEIKQMASMAALVCAMMLKIARGHIIQIYGGNMR